MIKLFRRDPLLVEAADIIETIGEVLYDFGLYSDKPSFIGRYQFPLKILGRPIIVSGWLKIQIDTSLLPKAVMIEDLQDDRLITLLRGALSRNVEFRTNYHPSTPSLFLEATKARSAGLFSKDIPFEFWYLVELDGDYLRSIPRDFSLDELPPPNPSHNLSFPFGISGPDRFYIADFPTEIISMLVAGATRQGKSTYIRSALMYLNEHYTQDQFQVILGDFKEPSIDFNMFIGHDWFTLVSTPLDLITRIEEARQCRLLVLSRNLGMNIFQYNQSSSVPLPYILVIIDEFAAFRLLCLTNKKTGREYLDRLSVYVATLASQGIYFIIGTQKPLVSILPSDLRANLLTRIAFSLPPKTDVDTVFGEDSEHSKFAVQIGCPGRAFCLHLDRFFEFQSAYS